MSIPDKKQNLNTCGCCGENKPKAAIYNRPGLTKLVYRIGEHGSFLDRMLSHIPGQKVTSDSESGKSIRPLSRLSTRAADDPSIALLDAWATTLDVLTFYQERVANEGFLRTATERRSLLELARAIGYELNPGVAASAQLSFTVEERDDPFRIATVPKGTQVMSIPDKGELPQTFETIEEIEARAEWNDMKPRISMAQDLALRADASDGNKVKLYFIDVYSNFEFTGGQFTITGDNKNEFYCLSENLKTEVSNVTDKNEVNAFEVNELYLDGLNTALKPGEYILIVGKNSGDSIKAEPFRLKDIKQDFEHKHTKVTIKELPADVTQPKRTLKLPALEEGEPSIKKLAFSKYNVDSNLMNFKWTQSNLGVMMNMNKWSRKDLKHVVNKRPDVKLEQAETGIFALRQKVGFFGHNAPTYCSVPIPEKISKDDAYPVNWDDMGNEDCKSTGQGAITIWKNPNIKKNAEYHDYVHHDVYLERDVTGILVNSWVVYDSAKVGQPQVYRISRSDETSMTGFTLASKITGLELTPPSGSGSINKSVDFKVRETSAYVQSEPLALAGLPLDDEIPAKAKEVILDELILDLKIGQTVVISGERQDAEGVNVSEIRVLREITHYGGNTALEFEDGLEYTYLRDSVTINANVAEATHGETVEEVLGSGDSSTSNQSFILRKPPLTHVSAETPSGSESTLEIRVNGIKWTESASLLYQERESESYIVRIDDDAVPTITFGDGIRGARLPSGDLNVTAVYRSGIGPDGEVEAESLTLLKKRPPGVASVINPSAASGAEEPESRDNARSNAPQTVRTLDRIVSLRDYEDFTNTFAGVGKAQAVAIWNGESYIVHVTVANAGGQEVAENDTLFEKLQKAIKLIRDPAVEFRVASFQLIYFNLTVNLKIDERFLADEVKEEVRTSLNDTFSFQKRLFGQVVTAAEITALIQDIEGIIYVDIDGLHLAATEDNETEDDITFSSVLTCASARWNNDADDIDQAQLLLVNPAGIKLSEISDE